MDRKLKFNKKYALLCLSIFLLECLILKTTGFIRHTFGDFLAVIMVYYLVKSFYNIKPVRLGIYVLMFAYTLEFLQLINFIKLTGLENNKILVVLLGNTFSIGDIIAYTLGVITVVYIEFNNYKPYFK